MMHIQLFSCLYLRVVQLTSIFLDQYAYFSCTYCLLTLVVVNLVLFLGNRSVLSVHFFFPMLWKCFNRFVKARKFSAKCNPLFYFLSMHLKTSTCNLKLLTVFCSLLFPLYSFFFRTALPSDISYWSILKRFTIAGLRYWHMDFIVVLYRVPTTSQGF